MKINFNENLVNKDIKLWHCLVAILFLVSADMVSTYLALGRQQQAYPDSWREKEMSILVRPLLYQFTLPIALVFGGILNYAIFSIMLIKTRSQILYGALVGTMILFATSNYRIYMMPI